jgi:hypothetical protein
MIARERLWQEIDVLSERKHWTGEYILSLPVYERTYYLDRAIERYEAEHTS